MRCFALLAGFPSDYLCILEFEAGAWWGEKKVNKLQISTGNPVREKAQEQIHGLTLLESGWM